MHRAAALRAQMVAPIAASATKPTAIVPIMPSRRASLWNTRKATRTATAMMDSARLTVRAVSPSASLTLFSVEMAIRNTRATSSSW